MSIKNPVIAITGSSGAGTTSVTRSFQHIFRREQLNAAIIEGDSFHRYDRQGMRDHDGRAALLPATITSATSAPRPTS
jgi:phosphoribulokinase